MTTRYAITITLRPKCYGVTIHDQYYLAKEAMSAFPGKLSLVTEITKSYNIHFHGYVELNKLPVKGSQKAAIYDYFRKSKVIGFIRVEELFDETKWLTYCIKDKENTQKELYFAPVIIRDDDNHFNNIQIRITTV